MKYFNNEHKKAYHLAIEKSGINDVYHQSLFYTLTIDKDCREHINDLYDFNRNSIKLSRTRINHGILQDQLIQLDGFQFVQWLCR